jgi:hypothetical protein
MSERGTQLLDVASRQIAELLELFSTKDEEAMRLPCPGREKLGDGTTGATTAHIAHVYQLLAGFVQTHADQTPARPDPEGGHRGRRHAHRHEHEAVGLQPSCASKSYHPACAANVSRKSQCKCSRRTGVSNARSTRRRRRPQLVPRAGARRVDETAGRFGSRTLPSALRRSARPRRDDARRGTNAGAHRQPWAP